MPELVLRNPDGTVALIRTILDHFRRHRAIAHDATEDLAPLAAAFREAAGGFDAFLSDADAEEPETAVIASRFRELAEAVESALPVGTPANLVSLLLTAPHPDLCTQAGGFRKYQKKAQFGSRRHGSRMLPDSLGRSGRWITSGFGTGFRMWTI